MKTKGSFTFSPPLNKEQLEYLLAFAKVDKYQHNTEVLARAKDPLREKVGLPLGEQGEYCVNPKDITLKYPSIISLDPPKSQPSNTCPWQPSVDGEHLIINRDAFILEAQELHKWAVYIHDHFLKKWGIALHGDVLYKIQYEHGVIVSNGSISIVTGPEFDDYQTMKQQERRAKIEKRDIRNSVNKLMKPKTSKKHPSKM